MRMSHGHLLLDEGNCSGALEQFDDAMEVAENDEETLFAISGRCSALMRLERPDDAREQLTAASDLTFSALPPVHNLVRVALSLGMHQPALTMIDGLIAAEQDISETHVLAFQCHTTSGQLSAARAALDRALELDPENGAALKERTRLNWAQGREAAALEDCEAALATGAADADLFWALGHLLKQAGRHEEAATAYSRFRDALAAERPA